MNEWMVSVLYWGFQYLLKVNPQILGCNVLPLHILDAPRFPGAAAHAAANILGSRERFMLQCSAQEERFQGR